MTSTVPVPGDPDYIPPYSWDLKNQTHIRRDIAHNTKVFPDMLQVIGRTPLVKLNNIPRSEGIKCDMYAKCEFLNPGGSVKDRIGYRMVLKAEQEGLISLEKKSVIIEPTSGNTGIGIALACATRGYRCIIVLPEKMSDEKVNTLVVLGSEIVRTPTEVASDDPASNIMVAKRLCEEIPNAVVLNQYENVDNPMAHYDGTAEEILWSLDNDVDMVVAGVGTGGTIAGISHRIKERCPKCTVVAADPYGSILAIPGKNNTTENHMYEVEGVGYDFIPKALDRAAVDIWVKTEDKTSFALSRRLMREEGLLCGGSCGAAMQAALSAARSLKEGQRCVVLMPDGMRNYMTKFVTDQWMEARGFKPLPKLTDIWWWDLPVSKLQPTPVVTVSINSSTDEALRLLRDHNLAVLPVLDPKKLLKGVFTADYMRKRITNHGEHAPGPVEQFVLKKFYKVKYEEATLGLVSRMLDVTPFIVVVSSSGKTETVVGVINSSDLMKFVDAGIKQTNGN